MPARELRDAPMISPSMFCRSRERADLILINDERRTSIKAGAQARASE
jgi:hypothetical protein